MKIVRLKKIATGTTGSEIAEAALVLPIFFLIMLGIYWFGRAFNTYATINHAAREGARVGVAQTCATCASLTTSQTTNLIAAQVGQSLQASRLDPTQVQNLVGTRTACGGVGSNSCQTPTPGPQVPQICVYYDVQLSTLPSGSGGPACGVSVEFQYPYQFSLPYTSLNMQKVTLNAGVQMTGEY